jgi:archaellum component FlaC
MNSEERLDQIEPLMADGLQKIDRLIEGQGKLVDLATKTDQKAETTAKGVGKLTLKVSQLASDQNEFRQEVREGFNEINQRFDQLVTLIQGRLR